MLQLNVFFKWIFLLFCFQLSNMSTAYSQTYIGNGGPIYDDSITVLTQSVSGLLTDKLRPQYGLQSVEININHTYLSNLEIFLMAPDGTFISLVRHKGGNTDYYTNTVFADTASLNIQSATNGMTPFTGIFQPKENLGKINNYQSGAGSWRLFVADNAANNTGDVINWKLIFGPNVPGITDTFSSNIPALYINSFNQKINDSIKIPGFVKIIDHNGLARNKAMDSVFQFFGKVMIKSRGNYSQNFPQKSYTFELNDDNDNDTSVALMGMPKESDWVLMNTWNDRSFIRNPLMYHLFKRMGNYATRYAFCEVFLNGEYRGIYQLTEKIKRDSNRVNIAKLKPTDLAGDSLSGGYIFKHDYVTDTMGWLSDVAPDACPTNFARYQNEYPSYDKIKNEQATYIRTYVDTIEKRLFSTNFKDSALGYRKFIDVPSFVDYLICNEFAWNGDGFAKSMYMHKDKDSKDTKLHAGPIWDFDWSLKKMPWVSDDIGLWSYTTNTCNNLQATLPWHYIMMKDDYFKNLLRCRYEKFREEILKEASINHFIDSTEAILNEAQIRHYQKWPTWGSSTGTPEKQPYSANMEQELDTLKSMISRRLTWLDNNIPGICIPLSDSSHNLNNNSNIAIYPNPTSGTLTFESTEVIEEIKITNSLGQVVYYKDYRLLESSKINIYLNEKPGIYFVNTKTRDHYSNSKIILD